MNRKVPWNKTATILRFLYIRRGACILCSKDVGIDLRSIYQHFKETHKGALLYCKQLLEKYYSPHLIISRFLNAGYEKYITIHVIDDLLRWVKIVVKHYYLTISIGENQFIIKIPFPLDRFTIRGIMPKVAEVRIEPPIFMQGLSKVEIEQEDEEYSGIIKLVFNIGEIFEIEGEATRGELYKLLYRRIRKKLKLIELELEG